MQIVQILHIFNNLFWLVDVKIIVASKNVIAKIHQWLCTYTLVAFACIVDNYLSMVFNL